MELALLTPTFWLLLAGSVLTFLLAAWRAAQIRRQPIAVAQQSTMER